MATQQGITANCLLNSPAECEKGEARRRTDVLGILNKNSFPVTVGALITLMEMAWKAGWCSGVRQTCDFELPPIAAPETAPASGGGGGAAKIDDLGRAPRMFDGALAYQPNIAVPANMASDAQTLKSWEATAKEESGAREWLNLYAAEQGAPVGTVLIDFAVAEIQRLQKDNGRLRQMKM